MPAGDLVESDMRRRLHRAQGLRLVGSGQTTLAPRPSAVDDWLAHTTSRRHRAAAGIHYPTGHRRNLVGDLASDRARANRLSGSSDETPDRLPRARRRQRDVMARAVAGTTLGKVLGQPLAIENRGGGGGSIGTRQVAERARRWLQPLARGTGTLAIDPTLYPECGL